MLDVIRILTKSDSEEEIKRIWEMGRSREIEYDTALLATPDGAEETIHTLSKNYLLGIVTSRVREGIYEVPQLAKLQNYFHVTISYQDTVTHKPDPEPLLLAAQRLAVSPAECVYVGDVENDVKAARAAGMRTIVYSKTRYESADAWTPLFTTLPKLIKDL